MLIQSKLAVAWFLARVAYGYEKERRSTSGLFLESEIQPLIQKSHEIVNHQSRHKVPIVAHSDEDKRTIKREYPPQVTKEWQEAYDILYAQYEESLAREKARNESKTHGYRIFGASLEDGTSGDTKENNMAWTIIRVGAIILICGIVIRMLTKNFHHRLTEDLRSKFAIKEGKQPPGLDPCREAFLASVRGRTIPELFETSSSLQEASAVAGTSISREASSSTGTCLMISSCTDPDLEKRKAFSEKHRLVERNEGDLPPGEVAKCLAANRCLDAVGIGIACRKGLKPESPNQDSFVVVSIPDGSKLLGVFDGHGPHGHDVSEFAREVLPKIFLCDSMFKEKPEEALHAAFLETQKMLDYAYATKRVDSFMSGTTCTMVWIPKGQDKLVIAHVGDSRAILVKHRGEEGEHQDLTVDHKPNLPEERSRIETNGGRVVFDGFYNHRVFAKGSMQPGLNMSRALGDLSAHGNAGISAAPDVNTISLTKGEDVAVVLCTDGVWEFIDSKSCAEEIYKSFSAGNRAQAMVDCLVKKSWDRWMENSSGEGSDDITAICVQVSSQSMSSSSLTAIS